MRCGRSIKDDASICLMFAKHQLNVAQLLLTHGDLDSRLPPPKREEYTRASARMQGCRAVINENDSVAVEELNFGDNDRLSAEVAGAGKPNCSLCLQVFTD